MTPFHTPLCDLFGIEYPIVQAGMGPGDTTRLAIAVSNAGGLGLISGNVPLGVRQGRSQHEMASDCIREAMENTEREKPFGVNIPVNSVRFPEVLRAVRDARKDPVVARKLRIIFLSAGDSAPYVRELKEEGLVCAGVVPTVYHAQKVAQAGIDAVVASGYEAGGHVNPDAVHTFVLVAATADAVHVPVIAAGGVADGKSLVAALVLGAQGAQMGTRFICTQEAGFHPNYKEAILKATTRDTIVVQGTLGPQRGLKNSYSVALRRMMDAGRTKQEIAEYKEEHDVLRSILDGDVDNAPVPAGQVAGRIHDVPTVHELIQRIMAEALEALRSVNQWAPEVASK